MQHSSEINKYAIFDSSMADRGETAFNLREAMPYDENEPLAQILNQANQDSSVQVIAWNDEPPTGTGKNNNFSWFKGFLFLNKWIDDFASNEFE